MLNSQTGKMFYDRGNRPGFHIFIISARSRNVKYILTENVPVKRFALSPGLFVIRAYAARLHPKGTSLALRAQGATSACGLLAMTNLRTSRHRMCRKDCQPAWRSLSAATDAIGAYRFNGGRYGLHVQRRARLSAPYIARPKACVLFILQYSFSTCPCFFPCRFTDSRHSAACLPGRRAGFPR